MLTCRGRPVLLDDVDLDDAQMNMLRNAIDRFSRDHDCSPGELVSFLDTVLVLNVPGWRATAIDRPDGSILIGIRRA